MESHSKNIIHVFMPILSLALHPPVKKLFAHISLPFILLKDPNLVYYPSDSSE